MLEKRKRGQIYFLSDRPEAASYLIQDSPLFPFRLTKTIAGNKEHLVSGKGYVDRFLLIAPLTVPHPYHITAFVRRTDGIDYLIVGHPQLQLAVVFHGKLTAACNQQHNYHND